MLDLKANPHRRYNPLSQEWVLVSPHRTARPWQGQVEGEGAAASPAYDPSCYLCPGNPRAGGVRNPEYQSTFVFDNDFAALKPEVTSPEPGLDTNSLLLRAESERGICRVVCFTPRHDLTLSTMTLDQIAAVIETWNKQFAALGAIDWIQHVQIFENRGAMMGASNPHPHCQIWATEHLPTEPRKEADGQSAYARETGRCLLCAYADLEVSRGERLIQANDGFVAVVPFWAVWPFEVLVISRNHHGSMLSLSPAEQRALAEILNNIAVRYDNLFQTSFPYSMGFHQSPTGGQSRPEWHLHAHFYPPLLRSATVRKFMVGFEMLGMPQRDITPETAADRLRAVSTVHYSLQGVA